MSFRSSQGAERSSRHYDSEQSRLEQDHRIEEVKNAMIRCEDVRVSNRPPAPATTLRQYATGSVPGSVSPSEQQAISRGPGVGTSAGTKHYNGALSRRQAIKSRFCHAVALLAYSIFRIPWLPCPGTPRVTDCCRGLPECLSFPWRAQTAAPSRSWWRRRSRGHAVANFRTYQQSLRELYASSPMLRCGCKERCSHCKLARCSSFFTRPGRGLKPETTTILAGMSVNRLCNGRMRKQPR